MKPFSKILSVRTLPVLLFCICLLSVLLSCPLRSCAEEPEVSLNTKKVTLFKGETCQLNLTGADETVTWKSTKPKVASVDSAGLISALSGGTAKIKAVFGGITYTCRLIVYNPGNVQTAGAQKGIDISSWQGQVDFEEVKKAGISFVILRIGHGTAADPYFEANYKKACAAGLKVGGYWFSTAKSKTAVKKEAARCLKQLSGKTLDFPVFFDIESLSQFRKGKKFCTAITNIFCSKIADAGFKAGWYTSSSFVTRYLKKSVYGSTNYMSWIAEHAYVNNYSQVYDIWQYSHTGRIPGVRTYVDMNWYFPAGSAV